MACAVFKNDPDIDRARPAVKERLAVEREDCGASWQDVWALADMASVKDRRRGEVPGPAKHDVNHDVADSDRP